MLVGKADGKAERGITMATNWEYIKAAIDGDIDDGGASEEAAIFYHITCPHYAGDPTAKCRNIDKPTRQMCVECKGDWLEAEYE